MIIRQIRVVCVYFGKEPSKVVYFRIGLKSSVLRSMGSCQKQRKREQNSAFILNTLFISHIPAFDTDEPRFYIVTELRLFTHIWQEQFTTTTLHMLAVPPTKPGFDLQYLTHFQILRILGTDNPQMPCPQPHHAGDGVAERVARPVRKAREGPMRSNRKSTSKVSQSTMK